MERKDLTKDCIKCTSKTPIANLLNKPDLQTQGEDTHALMLVCALDSNALSIASITILIPLCVTGYASFLLLYKSPSPLHHLFSFCRTYLRETHEFSEYFGSITLSQGSLNYVACVPNLAYHIFLNELLLEHNHPHSFMPYNCRVE